MIRVLLSFLLLGVSSAFATVRNSDGSAADIITHLGLSVSGDHVTIPAGGSFTWSTSFTVPAGVTLRGATDSNRPTIKVTGASTITLTGTAADVVALKDVKFNACDAGANSILSFLGSGVCFILQNVEFRNTDPGTWCAWIAGPVNGSSNSGPFGLVKNVDLVSTGPAFPGFFVRQNQFSADGWGTTLTWGTQKAVVFEDCAATAATSNNNGAGFFDGDTGARVVVRNSAFTNYTLNAHGNDSAAAGFLEFTAYDNTFTCNDAFWWQNYAMFLRGGTLNVHDNTLDATGGAAIVVGLKIHYFRASSNTGFPQFPIEFYPEDYPGAQQPGQPVPMYMWNNTFGGSVLFQASWGQYEDQAFIDEGRDYFLTARPGYSELAYPHPLFTGEEPPPEEEPGTGTRQPPRTARSLGVSRRR